MPASSEALTSAPSPNWLVSKFWQKTQRRLHQPKKIVPEPFQPRRQSSSPKCGNALATRASRPLLQTPLLLLCNGRSGNRADKHGRSAALRLRPRRAVERFFVRAHVSRNKFFARYEKAAATTQLERRG